MAVGRLTSTEIQAGEPAAYQRNGELGSRVSRARARPDLVRARGRPSRSWPSRGRGVDRGGGPGGTIAPCSVARWGCAGRLLSSGRTTARSVAGASAYGWALQRVNESRCYNPAPCVTGPDLLLQCTRACCRAHGRGSRARLFAKGASRDFLPLRRPGSGGVVVSGRFAPTTTCCPRTGPRADSSPGWLAALADGPSCTAANGSCPGRAHHAHRHVSVCTRRQACWVRLRGGARRPVSSAQSTQVVVTYFVTAPPTVVPFTGVNLAALWTCRSCSCADNRWRRHRAQSVHRGRLHRRPRAGDGIPR